MELKEFKKLKGDVDLIMAKIKEQALEEGVPIVSKKWKEVENKAKVNLLEQAEVNPEEYARLEKAYCGEEGFSDEVKKSRIVSLAEKLLHLGKKK